MMNKPYLVGITGGIGAGKSIVTEIFKLLNIPVYDADSQAKLLMVEDEQLASSIKQKFGEMAYAGGELNRQYLAERVFSNASETALLNSLVHPVVAKDFASWVRAQHAPYLIKEAALLFETGSYKELDTVILVTAPLETRIARTRQRDPQRSAQQIRNIISKQIKEEEAIPLADEVIYNDGRQLVIPQVIQLDSKIKRAIR